MKKYWMGTVKIWLTLKKNLKDREKQTGSSVRSWKDLEDLKGLAPRHKPWIPLPPHHRKRGKFCWGLTEPKELDNSHAFQ